MNATPSMEESFAPYTGRTLDHYKIGELIVRSQQGEFYHAIDTTTGRDVALEVLYAEDRANSEKFPHVLERVSALKHPHILQVIDYGTAVDMYYIVIPPDGLDDFTTLRDVLGVRRGGFNPLEAFHITLKLADALNHAHQQDIIHGDLNPSHIIMRGPTDPLLLNFGMAHILKSQIWSQAYLSPEQAAGKSATTQSDIYALGVIFYEMVVGRPPFIGDSPAEVLRQHLETPPTPPTELGANINQQVEAAILWMLAKRPYERPSTVQKMIEVLDFGTSESKYSTYVIKRSPITALEPDDTSPRSDKPTFKDRLLAWLGLRRD